MLKTSLVSVVLFDTRSIWFSRFDGNTHSYRTTYLLFLSQLSLHETWCDKHELLNQKSFVFIQSMKSWLPLSFLSSMGCYCVTFSGVLTFSTRAHQAQTKKKSVQLLIIELIFSNVYSYHMYTRARSYVYVCITNLGFA